MSVSKILADVLADFYWNYSTKKPKYHIFWLFVADILADIFKNFSWG
jgi:hypothetical protein